MLLFIFKEEEDVELETSPSPQTFNNQVIHPQQPPRYHLTFNNNQVINPQQSPRST